jgi:erythromycin esterase
MLIALALMQIQAQVDDAAIVNWLKRSATHIKTVQPGNGFDDLEPFGSHLGRVRIVGMGEPTHGTREASLFKHRMFEYLVERKGYRVFAMEASFPDCLPIDRYIQTGEGDAEAVVHGQGFWTWDTEEVLGLVQWMRSYNQAHSDHVHFVGFDMQAKMPAYARAAEYWKTWRPANEPEFPANPTAQDLISSLSRLSNCRNKLVRKSGSEAYETAHQCEVVAIQASKIEQQNLDETYKALTKALAKAQEGAKALSNAGWSSKALDELLKGLNDGTVGGSAARQSIAKVRALHRTIPPNSESIFTQMLRNLDEVVSQFAILDTDSGWRDRCMAENTAWIVDKMYPRSKSMLWAHNYHIGSSVPEDNSVDTMGRYLKKRFGATYFPVGFSFGYGSFQSRLMDANGDATQLQSFEVGTPSVGSLDETLGKAGSLFVAAFDQAPHDVQKWLDLPHPTRTCGSGYNPKDPLGAYRNDRPGKWYRAIVYLGKTTRSRPLKLTRERFGITKDW